ncbi:MAG: TIM barrel protein [Verrucomicrobiota bacterium]
MKRRQFLDNALAASATIAIPEILRARETSSSQRLGITMASYMQRWRNRQDESSGVPGWKDALDVLDHCKELLAGCLQIGVARWTEDFAGEVRDRRESYGIALEGQIRLPWETQDTERFEKDLRAAKEAGATVLRTVCLGGRRYETFETLDSWKEFVGRSYAALERAEPLAAKHGLKLGVENHKDWRTEEHLALLGHLDSEHVGVTFDFGNNIALLEDPVEQAEALAPWIISTHTKDMALASHPEGFYLSEVPLGSGVLDLPRLMEICRSHHPEVWFNLEMITRDPLEVPVLTDRYWETIDDSLPAHHLVKNLSMARDRNVDQLPHISPLELSDQLALEEKHIRMSFQHAQTSLGLV